MKRILLTGMSGTGKSTLICALATLGYRAIDADSNEWSEWVPIASEGSTVDSTACLDSPWQNQDWVWREDRIQRLLSTEDTDVLFVSGTAANQGNFHAQFDLIILLSAPASLLVQRLSTRTTNTYGKEPHELARVLTHIQTVEPLLRRAASTEVNTSVPLDQVLETILDLVHPERNRRDW